MTPLLFRVFINVFLTFCHAVYGGLVVLNVTEGRRQLWGKTRSAFSYVYKRYGDSFDWFLKADDDTYFIVENLRYFLNAQDPDKLLLFGQRTAAGFG
jgi:glycoprotein-N-acetylgalactosamine 3-beta-galactosyltransferase